MSDESHFEIGSAAELKRKYGLTAANRPKIRLEASSVPPQFRSWVRLAELWGIGDDLIREDCVEKATASELRELLEFGDVYNAVLSDWLAGAEVSSAIPSKEYVAFSCLGMAWDSARIRDEKEKKA